MTDAINNNHGRIKTTGPTNSPPAKSGGRGAAAPTNATTAGAADVLQLSSERILAQMAQLPEVDASRVEAIKTALARGDYQPDPEVTAQKFAAIEKLLP